MAGPNDFHMVGNEMRPGLLNGGPAVAEPEKVDGRTAVARKEKALEKMAAELDAERAKLDAERAEFEAQRSGGKAK